jgi:hypothetical protein
MPNLQKSLNSLKVKVNQIIPGTLGLSDSLVNVPNRLGFSYVKLLGNSNELIQAYNTTVTPQYGVPVLVQWNGTQYIVIGRDVQRYPQWNNSAYLPLHGDTHQWMGGDTTWIHSEQFYPLSVSPSGSSLFIGPYTYNWLGNWIYGGNTGTNTITLPSDPSKQKIMLLYLDGPTGDPTWLPGTEAPLYTNIYQLLPYLPSFNMSLGIPLAMVGIPSGTTSWTWSNLYDVRQFFGGSSGGTGSSGGGISEAPIDGNIYGRKNAGWSIVSGSSGGGGDFFGPASAVAHHVVTFADITGKIGEDSGHALSEYLTSVTAHDILSTTHGDTLAASVLDGSIIIGNATPAWSALTITVPAVNVRNVLGVDNTETRPSWKSIFDSTNPAALGSAGPGISLIASHRDHVHAMPSCGDIGAVPTTRKVNGQALSGDVALELASADFINQGTATTVLHGNAAGNPSFAAVALADMANMATASLIYRTSAGAGIPEINTLATLKTDLSLSGSNSGDNSANSLYTIGSNTQAWNAKLDTYAALAAGTGWLHNDGAGALAWTTPTGGGDISGTGIAGQVAEFVTNTKTLQAANLIAPTANILTLTNSAASTLALAITAGKTLTLTSADNYNLTVPATGTAALLATANIFTVKQEINVSSGSLPLYIYGTLTDNADGHGVEEWLYYTGQASILGHAIYSWVNKADVGYNADVHGLDINIGILDANIGGVHNIEGLQIQIAQTSAHITTTNAYNMYIVALTSGQITNAYGLYINNISAGATLNYAIYTNAGLVHFGDAVDAASLTLTTPLAVAQGGTGATNATDAKTNLGITSGSSVLSDERSWFLV